MLSLAESTIDKPRNVVFLHVVRNKIIVAQTMGLNARTDAGAQYFAQIAGQASAVPVNYVALSTATLTPVKTDTTLTGEITGTGLARKVTSYGSYVAPTVINGVASYTLTATFTNSTAGIVIVASAGCFTAVSGGTLCFETNFGASTTLQIGDTANLTWNFNV